MKACEAVVSNNFLNASSKRTCLTAIGAVVISVVLLHVTTASHDELQL